MHAQVGSVQLARLQKLLQEADGVYGARFSGAGTRGACVALVRANAAQAVAQQASHIVRFALQSRSCPATMLSQICQRKLSTVSAIDVTQVVREYATSFPELAQKAHAVLSVPGDGAKVMPL